MGYEFLNVFVIGVQVMNFSLGAGVIWLDNAECTGSERLLLDCIANSSGINTCTHAQDAGVRCPTGTYTYLICQLRSQQ